MTTSVASGGAGGGTATPLMQQYREIKSRHTDAILFFRMGDFYEMFYEDAEVASRALGLTLTSRNNGGAAEVPLAGVPVRAQLLGSDPACLADNAARLAGLDNFTAARSDLFEREGKDQHAFCLGIGRDPDRVYLCIKRDSSC